MTSLRLRLFAMLVATTVLVWAGAAAWTGISTKAEVERVLDRRLREAARMVASLGIPGTGGRGIAPTAAVSRYDRQLSCQIWSFDGRAIGLSASAPAQPLASTSPGRTGFSNSHVGGEEWRVFTLVDQAHRTRVMVGDNLKVRRRVVNDLMLGLLIPALAGVAALSFLLWSTLGRGLAPLRAIADSLEHRSPDDVTPIPPIAMLAELAPITTALNGLFARLADARDAERSFVANAAHELQTPLAGVATHAHIAWRSAEPAVRQRAAERIAESVDRMGRLVRQLLILARQERQMPAAGTADLSDVAKKVAAELTDAARVRGIELRLGELDHPIRLTICDERLHTAVRNLVENAICHGPCNAPVRLSWTATARRFDVDDEGAGLSEEEAARVRRRFERGKGAAALGSGLGLSIVDAALKGTPLTLELRRRPEGGFRASIADGAGRSGS